MVVQKPVRPVGQTKVRSTVKRIGSEKEEVMELAGPREAAGLELLHTIFMKRLAEGSNMIAFKVELAFLY